MISTIVPVPNLKTSNINNANTYEYRLRIKTHAVPSRGITPIQSPARLGLAMGVATGLFFSVCRANAATTVTTADQNFILAAAQGGMTEVKMGRIGCQKWANATM